MGAPTLPSPRLRKSIRISVGLAGAALLTIILGVAWRRGSGNIGVVEPGRVYRSAQLDADHLARLVLDRGIKTIVNLRGPNPEQPWYRAERAAILEAGATLVDVPLASDMWLSNEQARTILEVIDESKRPVLIHCEFGAERTGLVSAIVELLEPGRTLADARAQFSIRYLFLPIRDGRTMLGHLDRYEAALRSQGLAHSPAAFRRWLLWDYQPDSPSREEWPCNPYPRKVVTAPGPDGRPRSTVDWPADPCPNRVAVEPKPSERR